MDIKIRMGWRGMNLSGYEYCKQGDGNTGKVLAN